MAALTPHARQRLKEREIREEDVDYAIAQFAGRAQGNTTYHEGPIPNGPRLKIRVNQDGLVVDAWKVE